MIEGFTFSGDFIGKVLDRDTTTGKLAVYIPKLMPKLDSSQLRDTYIKTIQSNNTLYDSKYYKNIKTQNYIWVSPFNKDTPLPLIGSKVLIRFIDSNPNLGMWAMLNVNDSIYKTESEEERPGILEGKDLSILNKAELPKNTKIGEFTYSDLENLKKYKTDLDKEIENIKKDIQKMKKIKMSNISVPPSSWVEDDTYVDYNYKADIICPGMTVDHYSNIIFSPSSDLTNLYPLCMSGDNIVTIYCKTVPLVDIVILYIFGEVL